MGDAGYECRVIDSIAISFRNDPKMRAQIQLLAEEKCTVVFTSSNAVQALAALLEGRAPKNDSWQVFCLSGKTLETVKALLPQTHIVATAPDSAALALLLASAQIYDCHFFCGGSRMDTLPRLMQQFGIALNEHVVYDTILNKPVLDFSPCAALFFSPSAIESLSANNDLSEIPLFVCIGNSTAAAIPDQLQHNVVVASEHSKESVVNTLLQSLNK